MRVVFDTKTGLLTIDGRTLKLVQEDGTYSIEGLSGDEENSSLAGMCTVSMHDTLRDLQKAEKAANCDPRYDNDPWATNLDENTLDLMYEVLV